MEHEVERVTWYLGNFAVYAAQGYRLRFPAGVNPEDRDCISNAAIREAVSKEIHENSNSYEQYAQELEQLWPTIAVPCVPVAQQVYGFTPSGHFELVPTAYGTGGGQLVTSGPIYCRLPSHRQFNKDEAQFLVHEILAHGVTAHLRDGTAIDESNPRCSHQDHKERLMDLLGRTLLVRSHMRPASQVLMQPRALANAASDIDPLYYIDSRHPDEFALRYEGKLPDLIRELDLRLKS